MESETLSLSDIEILESILSINEDLGIQFVPIIGAADSQPTAIEQTQEQQTNVAFNPAILYLKLPWQRIPPGDDRRSD